MIDFKPLDLERKAEYDKYLMHSAERGCEYSFTNLFCWGRQMGAFEHGHLVLFSQFNRRTVYAYPVGSGDKKAILGAIITDARQRGIPCRLTGMTGSESEELERLYPGRFRIHCDRNGFDYVYDIHDLADLKGRKYQKKRNHLHRFDDCYPGWSAEPITGENLPQARELAELWYAQRQQLDPKGDYHMERAALMKALKHYEALGLDGILLRHGGKTLAMTLGSFLSKETFDINFEKALAEAEGAYAAVNNAFARYLREKYPGLRYLNREDDLGLEGLRKAKLSYCPHHMVEKSWACLLEDAYEY